MLISALQQSDSVIDIFFFPQKTLILNCGVLKSLKSSIDRILAFRTWELNLTHIEKILLKHLIILREANPLGFGFQ